MNVLKEYILCPRNCKINRYKKLGYCNVKAKKEGLKIPIVYNTSNYENVDTIKMMDGVVDIYLADLKYYDNKYGEKYSNVKDYFKYASLAISEMYKQVGKPIIENNLLKKGVVVRILLLPGLVEDAKNVVKYLYTKYHKVLESEYEELVNYACDLGIKNAFIQEGDTCSESFIPDFNLDNV